DVGDPPDAMYDTREQAVMCMAPTCRGTPARRGAHRAAQMVPAPFVVACPSGHLDDFPWRAYAHRGVTGCPARLKPVGRGETGTVTDLWIICDCGKASRSMSDAFGENAVDHISQCGCGTPWIRPGSREQNCQTPLSARTMQRGATNGWFPIVKSALKIGP